ncbi:MAG: glycosyltransferase [Myxococcota bacterium]
MRIAIFSEVFRPKIDGITNRLDQTIRCLRDAGHEVLVFAPAGSVDALAGFRVVQVPGPPFPPYPGLRISAPDPRILLELRSFEPDVVHAVGPACLGVWGLLAARALGLPAVASYHTDLPRYLPAYGLDFLEPAIWPLIRRVHGLAHVNLAPSRFTRNELYDQGIEPVGLWRGGVDTERFHPEKRSLAMRARLAGGVGDMGGIPDGPLLLYAGRLSPEKQLHTFGPILEAFPAARLALVGDGPAREELERTLPADRTTFTGFLRGDALAAAFASADVFVMPSTTETLGFVVLEAMASGVPVVAARAGGVPDLVTHGESGLLY